MEGAPGSLRANINCPICTVPIKLKFNVRFRMGTVDEKASSFPDEKALTKFVFSDYISKRNEAFAFAFSKGLLSNANGIARDGIDSQRLMRKAPAHQKVLQTG